MEANTDNYPPKTVRVQVEIDVDVFPYDDLTAVRIAKEIVKDRLGTNTEARLIAAWVIPHE